MFVIKINHRDRQPSGPRLHRTFPQKTARVGYRIGGIKKFLKKNKINKIPPMSKCKWLDYYNINKSSFWRLFLSKATIDKSSNFYWCYWRLLCCLETQLLCSAERRHIPLCVQAANESRMRMAAAVPTLAYRAGLNVPFITK